MPAWKVRIGEARLQKPDAMLEAGQVFNRSQDNKVLRGDLKIRRED